MIKFMWVRMFHIPNAGAKTLNEMLHLAFFRKKPENIKNFLMPELQ